MDGEMGSFSRSRSCAWRLNSVGAVGSPVLRFATPQRREMRHVVGVGDASHNRVLCKARDCEHVFMTTRSRGFFSTEISEEKVPHAESRWPGLRWCESFVQRPNLTSLVALSATSSHDDLRVRATVSQKWRVLPRFFGVGLRESGVACTSCSRSIRTCGDRGVAAADERAAF
jgi:hypothetical protein